jgi:hypothetical protein
MLGVPLMRVLTDDRMLTFMTVSAETCQEVSDHPENPG